MYVYVYSFYSHVSLPCIELHWITLHCLHTYKDTDLRTDRQTEQTDIAISVLAKTENPKP